DELAEKLDMSPVQLRKNNMLKTGSITATGQKIGSSCGLNQAFDKVLEEIRFKRYNSKNTMSKIKKGMGLSAIFYGVGVGAEGKYFAKAAAQVYVKEDGSVVVAAGNVEMGQGAETVLNRICSKVLGCTYDMVEILQPDTTRVPDSGPTVASRTTMVAGRALMDAAGQILDTFKKVAADKLGVKPFNINVEDNYYKSPKGQISYQDVVKEAYQRREKVAAQGWFKIDDVSFDKDTGSGAAYPVYSFSANACEVEVDTQTGQVTVTKFAAAHDVGKVIHMNSAQGQIQGGVVQGIGYALYENLCLEDGRIVNPSLTGYTIPTSMDVCDVKPILVESPYEQGPYGAKGLGEPPIIGVAPAIINAIYDAIGVRIRDIPALPEDVLRNLKMIKQ
ncbi:xanthine dehydrogenase family protein molybdopterin-binding subunit, partial [Elusimicrobiota bacterium]